MVTYLKYIRIALLSAGLIAVRPAPANDVVGTLLKDTVATFSDSYDLIYYSVKSALVRDLKAQKATINETTAVTNERIETYLESRGITVRRDRQPIQRKEFARLVMQRFELPLGVFTKVFGTAGWYYRDAVRAGLFSENEAGDETMSTREMLSVFSRAESLSRQK
ncbi:hypothetical protein [Turneriella parva]|uniref:DUF4294 domain-containing protein n=1 Tax=Turneriella parva (strain ATCC BAA-1111 / DSM 21527 / NCTC 11395 / H) TaxID=869212 RepID=I4BB84_TURPD|nr:hypothetical protein [Turneriella parva]AFM14541.1 hypothetical protein Turpa_3907 [Turneriella parva DSM 21527]